MSNIIFISSVLAAFIWALCYFLISMGGYIHIVLIIAFIGTAASIMLHNDKEISKQ